MLAFISNTKYYQPNDYGEKMVIENPTLFAQSQINHKFSVYELQKHHADSEESLLGLGLIPNNQMTWFDFVSRLPDVRDLPDQNYFFSVEFRLNRDVIEHKRSIYTFLDLIGDIGGLLDGLTAIGGFLMSIFCFIFGNPLDSYLLRSQYKAETMDAEPLESTNERQIQRIQSRKPFISQLFLLCRPKAQASMEHLGK